MSDGKRNVYNLVLYYQKVDDPRGRVSGSIEARLKFPEDYDSAFSREFNRNIVRIHLGRHVGTQPIVRRLQPPKPAGPLHLGGFYNYVHQSETITPEEKERLKGIGHLALCNTLALMVDTPMLTRAFFPDGVATRITLEASGEMRGKASMEGLVQYYKTLGFREMYPEQHDKLLAESDVPMESDAGTILRACREKYGVLVH